MLKPEIVFQVFFPKKQNLMFYPDLGVFRRSKSYFHDVVVEDVIFSGLKCGGVLKDFSLFVRCLTIYYLP